MSLTFTEPSAEPVTVAQAKAYVRQDASDTDTQIGELITRARKFVEAETNRAFIDTTFVMRLDQFPKSPRSEILVSRSPLDSVDSIQYVDTDGTTQTLATSEYTVDANSEPGRIVPSWGNTWPSTRAVMDAVTVTFVAGYGAIDDVPEDIKQAIHWMIRHYDENREPALVGTISSPLPMGVKSIVGHYFVPSPVSRTGRWVA